MSHLPQHKLKPYNIISNRLLQSITHDACRETNQLATFTADLLSLWELLLLLATTHQNWLRRLAIAIRFSSSSLPENESAPV
jgi:hypothetical protein